jgi:hypothetical protein
MRKLLVPLGVIAAAFAVAAPALGAYKTSPQEGRGAAQSVVNDYPDPSQWPFRNCWRIGPKGAGWWSPPGGVGRGGIVCRFSTWPPAFNPDLGYACLLREIAVKEIPKKKKKIKGIKKIFALWEVSRGNSQRETDPIDDGPSWCNREPGAEEPPLPTGAIGPALF